MRFLFSAVLVLCCCSCANRSATAPVQTYAELEGAVWRNAARYHASQLTRDPEQNLDSSGLSFRLFFQLPFSQRVIAIMASFAQAELDGESAERMYAMLCNRTQPGAWWEAPYPPTPADRAYTRAIFLTIDAYSDEQIRSFCLGMGDAALFRKNLKHWKEHCGISPAARLAHPAAAPDPTSRPRR